jgi:4-amino-4-deoxy-L-arabinose transferase-like glycosyltransferase
MSNKINTERIKTISILSFIFLGVILRLLLFWANPPQNHFDDHYSPIFFILHHGALPPKEACIECYQPPVFYYTSAMVGKLLGCAGLNNDGLLKCFQFIPCFYGILTLIVIYKTLNKFKLSNFSKILSMGAICFLPRHIYMGAIHSNDTMSYLFVALSVYMMLHAIEKKFSLYWLFGLSFVILLTVFTKYTSIVVIPMVIVTFSLFLIYNMFISRKKIIVSFIVVIFIPILFLSFYGYRNINNYGNILPVNIDILHVQLRQPPGEGKVNYFNFKPLELIKSPILSPTYIESFWTQIYGGMWFDVDPQFYYMDEPCEFRWREQHFAYLSGSISKAPGINALDKFPIFLGSALIIIGFPPFLLMITGIFQFLYSFAEGGYKENKMGVIIGLMMLTVILCNVAGVVFHSSIYPFYSCMKASFFLNSLPSFLLFIGNGLMFLERRSELLKKVLTGIFLVLFLTVILHIAFVAFSIGV